MKPMSTPSLRDLLKANADEMRVVRSSAITNGPVTTATTEPTDDVDAKVRNASLLIDSAAAAQEAELQSLRAEVSRLSEELAQAHERATTIAECQRRQTDIHSTLLRAAHDEAVAARDEARAEAEAMRQRVSQVEAQAAEARQHSEIRERTALAEAGLHAAAAAASREELLGSRLDARSVVGVHLALLRSELAMSEATQAQPGEPVGGSGGTRMHAASLPPPSSLREIQQWSGVSVSGTVNAAAAKERNMEWMAPRLERLEQVAEAASHRFEELQREYEALRLRHARLQRRLRQRTSRDGEHGGEGSGEGDGGGGVRSHGSGGSSGGSGGGGGGSGGNGGSSGSGGSGGSGDPKDPHSRMRNRDGDTDEPFADGTGRVDGGSDDGRTGCAGGGSSHGFAGCMERNRVSAPAQRGVAPISPRREAVHADVESALAKLPSVPGVDVALPSAAIRNAAAAAHSATCRAQGASDGTTNASALEALEALQALEATLSEHGYSSAVVDHILAVASAANESVQRLTAGGSAGAGAVRR